MKKLWAVVVGNLGTVYTGTCGQEAAKLYKEYVQNTSSRDEGRVWGEPVTLLFGEHIMKEHRGSLVGFED